jgi:transcriptional antiterminator NusG
VGASKVSFDQGDRIQVLSGPMQGLEGQIKKVNKRKGRAKIELMLYEESFLIDFAFDIIGKVTEKKNG